MQDSQVNCTTQHIDVGTPSSQGEWNGFQFSVHNFASLPAIRDQEIDPPGIFCCFGRKWSLSIYPGGQTGVRDGHVAATLFLLSGPSVNVNYKASANFATSYLDVNTSGVYEFDVGGALNFSFNTRQTILANPGRFLVGGRFTFSLYMKEIGAKLPHVPKNPKEIGPKSPYVPKNPFQQIMLRMLEDEKSADVTFEISGGKDDDEPAQVHAHRFVLKACAPALTDLCAGSADSTPVPITGIKSEIFRALVRYAYGGEVPDALLRERAKELIEAADKFAISNLKVEAEAAYVKFTTINIDNVVENFYFADTKKCALLKERVMDFLVQNSAQALSKISSRNAPESATLFHDFLAAVSVKSADEAHDGNDPAKFKTMPVDTLRRKLSDRGLDVDGTREMLVAALEGSCANKGEKRKRDDDATSDGDE